MHPVLCRFPARPLRKLGVAIGLLLAAPLFVAADEAPSSLKNGDFETANGTGSWPAGWSRPDSGASRWERGDQGRYLSLRASSPGQIVLGRQSIALRPEWRAMELGLRARCSNLAVGAAPWHDARVVVLFRGADGATIAGGRHLGFSADTAGWAARSLRFPVPPGAVELELVPALIAVRQGTFDLDDVVLSSIDPAKLTAAERAVSALVDLGPSTALRDRWPAQLHVAGNRLHDPAKREVWLQDVNVVSLEWQVTGEHLLRAIDAAVGEWKSNVVRLPVTDKFWFGRGPGQTDGGLSYRARVDDAIAAVAGTGAYVVLDLHGFLAPTSAHVAFWKDAARRHRDHPAVLFDLFNEPNSISWETWRDGGFVEDPAKPADAAGKKPGFESVGMQALVDAVRSVGARNIVVAGGLDWAYDLTGIARGFALNDRGGNGVMYSAHIYSWKRDWDANVMIVAKDHPVLLGEVGCDVKRPSFVPEERHESPYTWAPDMIGYIQKHRLNWTAFSLHPAASPVLISDWKFTPTPFWGEYVKRALAGAAYEMKNVR